MKNTIVQELEKHRPTAEQLIKQFGYTESDALQSLVKWNCRQKSTGQKQIAENILLDFVYNYDVELIYILDFGFEPQPFEHERGLVVGYMEDQFILIDIATGEVISVLMDPTLDNDTLLSPNPNAFAEVLIKLIAFMDPFGNSGDERSIRLKLLEDIFAIVSDQRYMDYYIRRLDW